MYCDGICQPQELNSETDLEWDAFWANVHSCQCPLCCDNHQTFDLIWIWLRHWEQSHLNHLHVWIVICCSHLDDGTERLKALSSAKLFTVFELSLLVLEACSCLYSANILHVFFYVIHTMHFLVFCIFKNQQKALIKIQ